MNPHRSRSAGVLVGACLACWGATAWLAREPEPWAIRSTDWAFAFSLAGTYATIWCCAGVSRGTPRETTVRALATTLVLAVLLALAEGPALFGVLDYSWLWSRASGEWNGPAASFETDRDLVYRRPAHKVWSGRPRSDMAVAWNLPTRAASVQKFTTDAHGFRNRRELDRADIALVGDSYVEGAYVSDDETCAVDLENMTGLPVANLGVSGYGTLQELKVVERDTLRLHSRMLAWFFFEGNDLYDDEAYENALEYLQTHGSFAPRSRWTPDWRRVQDASLTLTAYRWLRRVSDPLFPNSVATSGWFRGGGSRVQRLYFYNDASLAWGAFERQRLEKTEAAFSRGAGVCKEHAVRLIVVFVPSKFRVYGGYCAFPPGSPCRLWQAWQLRDELAAFFGRAAIQFVDLTEPMREAAAAGRLLYAPEDSHWNAEGHRFVAGLLAEEWRRSRP